MIFRLFTPEEVFNIDAVLVDTRRAIEYRAGHIPGAVSIPLSRVVKIRGLALDIPSRREIESILSSSGIEPNQWVVAYDDSGGVKAARFLYTLEIYGHEKLGLLDRTYSIYVEEGGKISREKPKMYPTNYVATLDDNRVLTKEKLLQLIHSGEAIIVDTRSREEYLMGHIPRAINIPWLLVAGYRRVLKNPEEISSIFSERGIRVTDSIITYCNEGTASALVRYGLFIAGYEKVLNYYLSYNEWGSDPTMPKVVFLQR